MSSPLPYLRNTTGTLNAQVLYPFTRTVEFMTTVNTFANGSEQRWPERPPLYTFALAMSMLNTTDKAAWLSFFNSQKGRFQTNLQITLSSTTYSNLALMSDDLAQTNDRGLLYNQQVNLRQVSNYPWTAPSVGTSFPTLSFGSVAEYPLTDTSSFMSDVNESPLGPRFVWSWYGSSLTNFPTGYLKAWRLSYPLISDADRATLETYFLGQQGRYGSFSFTSPIDSTTYSHVRFASDSLAIKHLTKNQQSTEITLIQTNGS